MRYRYPNLKSRCRGDNTLSTNVDGETLRYVEREADRAEIPKSELLRRLIDYYRGRERMMREELDL